MGYFARLRSHFNKKLVLSLSVVAVSAFNFGFDNQGFSTAQAMDPFIRQFGVYNAEKDKYELQDYWLSLYSSLIFIGYAFGVWIGSVLSARKGRKVGMLAMSCWVFVAASIIISSSSRWQILAGRVLFYIYQGMELAVVPVYQAEVVPAEARAFVLSTYQFSLLFGGLIINLICLGTQTIPNNNAWRIPFALFYTAPVLVLSGLYFIPESPRWLLLKGRKDEARQSLSLLREGKRTDNQIGVELENLQIALESEVEQGRFRELFQGINRKRTMIAIGINFFQEIMGQQIVSKFGALMVKSIGNPSPFVMTVVFAITNLIFTFIGMIWSDRFGRRPFLLLSAAMQSVALFALGAIGTFDWENSPSLSAASIFLLVMQTAGFSIGYAPLTNAVMTELPAAHLRDWSQRTAATVRVVANFVVGFIIPYLMKDLSLELGFVFAPICFLGIVFTYFCVPECKGKSLETIEYMFQAKVPIRKFGSYDASHLDVETHLGGDKEGNGTGKLAEVENVEEVAAENPAKR
ncbi:sugar transporter [Xylariomycetidae sp. FL0641]|nr:sugar transporter [Xylariomycetidae sp. FL0641]